MMDAKRWTLLIAMIGALMVTAFAKDGNENDEKREAVMKARRTYFKENIKPKVDAQRIKLEESLTTKDRQEVAFLREEMVNQKLILNEFLSEARAWRIKGEEMDEDLSLEIEAQRIVMDNLFDQAEVIVGKYHHEIDVLLAELRAERNTWRSQVQTISGSDESKAFKGVRAEYQGAFEKAKPRCGHRSEKEIGEIIFLLWDVNRS
jgi:capsule polysaccharide export protein KpsE/RkpR